MVAAASPIAAIESRGAGSATTWAGCEVRQLAAYGVLVRGTGDHEHPLADQRQQPVDRRLQQRAPGAGEVVQELRRRRPRQRPEPGAGTARRDDCPQPLDRIRHGGHPRVTRRAVTTFEQVLVSRLRNDPGQPLVTFYDDATGERTELSVTTYANWVAKTAGVLIDDLGLDAGDRVALDLPTPLARPGVPRRRLAGRARGGHRRPTRTWWCTGPTGRRARRRTSGWAARCCRSRSPPASRCPTGCWTTARSGPGSPTRSSGSRAVPDDAALDGADQAGADRPRRVVRRRRRSRAHRPEPGGRRRHRPVRRHLGAGRVVVWTARPDPERWAGRAGPEQATREVRAPVLSRPGRTSRTRPRRSGAPRARCRTWCPGPATGSRSTFSRASRSGTRSPSTSPAPTTQS